MTFLITAGPTREPLDPVRYLTNRSSGKMGYAIAEAAALSGNRVILISGPTQLEIPDGVDFIPVETAQEMFDVVLKWIDIAGVAIFTAAVADYRPANLAEQKIKKQEGQNRMTLELVKNVDILGSARALMGFSGLLVGFAAETENLEQYAKSKLKKKGCDIVFANDVSGADTGFDVDQNALLMVTKNQTKDLGRHSKKELGKMVVQATLEHLGKGCRFEEPCPPECC